MKKASYIILRMTIVVLALFGAAGMAMAERQKFNFNLDWKLIVGDIPVENIVGNIHSYDDKATDVTLPHALNENQAFRVSQKELLDTVAWYYKTFSLDNIRTRKVMIEFQGARQAAFVYVNGKYVGMHEDGVMAFGFDLTPYVKEGRNEIAVRVDNRAGYKEKATGVGFEWNDMSFNANYGGLNHSVNLYITDNIYQTLPLYSGLGTTGTYIYGSDYDIRGHKATVNVESQIRNESGSAQKVALQVEVVDKDGKRVGSFRGRQILVKAGETVSLYASKRLAGLHFWSIGYGYLYTVRTCLVIAGKTMDTQTIRTGFRKAEFKEGKIWLNDRVMMVKGYAQRSTNEWPAVGMDVPAWMSDYSNGMMTKGNANTVRWMHITPAKQDIESCDRVGLVQAMPAGDHEGDAKGRQWEQRVELMRDAIIYNRNNPSILFYECGNESISREHMLDMLKVKAMYDPKGYRAIGSREMLDIQEAEYGGEMLYTNKSGQHPVWAMEYCRDEGYRMYWDNLSYPYHYNGQGPYLKKQPVPEYNQNQDSLVYHQIKCWDDFWKLRPGMGKRVSSGGVKIIFSETNTHSRSEFCYRVSGNVDAMRIEKDGYKAHRVMWDGWVENEKKETAILGHWNYQPGVVKNIQVVSNSPVVELFVNGKSVGKSEVKFDFLHTIKNVEWKAGTLRAVGMAEDGTIESECTMKTAKNADHIVLSLTKNPDGMKADGNDIAIIQAEVVDKNGLRCPLDNHTLNFSLTGPGEWLGGIAKSPDGDNHILDTSLPVECGVNRVMVRSTREAGHITLRATAKGLAPVEMSFDTEAIDDKGGLTSYFGGDNLPLCLDNGETPQTPSYTDHLQTIDIVSAEAGSDSENARLSFDDNELSEWKNDGRSNTAWIKYTLSEPAAIDQIDMKLTGWRSRSYPLEIYADSTLIWKGYTAKSLGYISLAIDHPVKAKTYTIRQVGKSTTKDAFAGIVEVAAPTAGELDLFKTPNNDKVNCELRIVEIDFLRKLK